MEVDAAWVLVVRRTGGWYPSTPETKIAVLPADEAPPRLAAFTAEQAYSVPRIRFGSYPWSLERPEVQRLIDRITGAGVPLRDYLGASPAAGARTGLNDAFVVDDATRTRIVAAHSGAADLLHPLIRTQEIERWAAAWGGAWLIAIPSSDERAWPWTGAADGDAEALFQRGYPSLHAHLKPW